MHQSCRKKLLDAGFTVLRKSETEPLIKKLKEAHSWETYGKYPSMAAMNREIQRIYAEEPKIIFE